MTHPEVKWIYRSSNGIDLECWCMLLELSVRKWRTGYVKLPPGWPEDLSPEEVIRVHGGVTFDRDGVIGFDTAHGGDKFEDWTLDLVKEETEHMAEQVALRVPGIINLIHSVEE